MKNLVDLVQMAKHAGQLRFAHHPLQQAFERDILPSHIKQALDSEQVEIVAEQRSNPDNPSPASTLLGWDERERALHVVIAYRRLLVVTAYEPVPPKWVTPRQRGK